MVSYAAPGWACGGFPGAMCSIPEVGTRSPEMEKRIFTAVIISIAVLWLWAAIAPKLFPDLVKPRTNLNTPQKTAAPATKPAAVSETASAPPTAHPVPPQPAALVAPTSPIAATAIIYTSIQTDDSIARFSNRGAE